GRPGLREFRHRKRRRASSPATGGACRLPTTAVALPRLSERSLLRRGAPPTHNAEGGRVRWRSRAARRATGRGREGRPPSLVPPAVPTGRARMTPLPGERVRPALSRHAPFGV